MSPRSAEANRQMRQRAREQILEGALAVFAEHGPHAASMREIADRAGVSKGLAYRYFPSKEELLAEVLTSRLAELEDVVEAAAEESSAAAALAVLIDGLLAQAVREPAALRLYLILTLEVSEEPPTTALRPLRERMERYMGAFRELMSTLGSETPAVDALLLRSALLGLCVRLACGNQDAGRVAVRRRLHGLFLPGGAAGRVGAPSGEGRGS